MPTAEADHAGAEVDHASGAQASLQILQSTRDLPRVTIFAAALTSGTLLGIAAYILAGRAGLPLDFAWAKGGAANPEQIRAAIAWWIVAGGGFAGGFVGGWLMQDIPGRRPRTALRLIAGAAMFIILASVPYAISLSPAAGARELLLSELGASGLVLLTAFCGGWFSLPRR